MFNESTLKIYKNKLYKFLGKDVVKIFQESNVIISGGAILSLISNTPVHDYDVYFRNGEDLDRCIKSFLGINYSNGLSFGKKKTSPIYPQIVTNKSIVFDENIQFIYFDFFENSEKIWDKFDFSVCMCSFDFKDESFHFHDNFILSLAQKKIIFNENTTYPLISLQRILKYKEKGFYADHFVMLKIGLCISKLNINTWDDFFDNISGFYGFPVSEFFKKEMEEPFDISLVIEKLGTLYEINECLSTYDTIDNALHRYRQDQDEDSDFFTYATRSNQPTIDTPLVSSFKGLCGGIQSGTLPLLLVYFYINDHINKALGSEKYKKCPNFIEILISRNGFYHIESDFSKKYIDISLLKSDSRYKGSSNMSAKDFIRNKSSIEMITIDDISTLLTKQLLPITVRSSKGT